MAVIGMRLAVMVPTVPPMATPTRIIRSVTMSS
jgi:hypothetical protein